MPGEGLVRHGRALRAASDPGVDDDHLSQAIVVLVARILRSAAAHRHAPDGATRHADAVVHPLRVMDGLPVHHAASRPFGMVEVEVQPTARDGAAVDDELAPARVPPQVPRDLPTHIDDPLQRVLRVPHRVGGRPRIYAASAADVPGPDGLARPAFEDDVLHDDPIVCRSRCGQALRLVPPEVGQHAATLDLDDPSLRLLHRIHDAPELHVLDGDKTPVQHDLELSTELPVRRWGFDVRRLEIVEARRTDELIVVLCELQPRHQHIRSVEHLDAAEPYLCLRRASVCPQDEVPTVRRLCQWRRIRDGADLRRLAGRAGLARVLMHGKDGAAPLQQPVVRRRCRLCRRDGADLRPDIGAVPRQRHGRVVDFEAVAVAIAGAAGRRRPPMHGRHGRIEPLADI